MRRILYHPLRNGNLRIVGLFDVVKLRDVGGEVLMEMMIYPLVYFVLD